MILSDVLFYYDYHIFIRDSFIGKFISKLFNINSYCSTIFIFSMFTSSPNNSVYIKNMLDNKCINEDDASRLLVFTYFPSFLFVIGTIGILMYKSVLIGFILYLDCLLNNIMIGLFLRKKYIGADEFIITKESNLFCVIKSSISKAINNCYIILGNLIIFSVIINIINEVIGIDVSLIFELTNGLNSVFNFDVSLSIKLFFTSFCLNFSGLSILFQSFSILGDYNLNIKKILIIKLIFSLLSSSLLPFCLEIYSSVIAKMCC